MKFGTLLLLILIGCSPAPPIRVAYQPQTCLKCGAEFDVLPANPSDVVPSTIEWCFHDGKLCHEGLDLIIEGMNKGDDTSFLEHCKKCEGCKCATFTPEEWSRLNE